MSEEPDPVILRMRWDYLIRLPERIAEIERHWLEHQEDEAESEALASVQKLIHQLVGSGGTIGVDEVSDLSRPMDLVLQEALDNNLALTPATRACIDEGLAGLKTFTLKRLMMLVHA